MYFHIHVLRFCHASCIIYLYKYFFGVGFFHCICVVTIAIAFEFVKSRKLIKCNCFDFLYFNKYFDLYCTPILSVSTDTTDL